MVKSDYLMWGIMGLFLAVYMPLGLMILVYLVIREIGKITNKPKINAEEIIKELSKESEYDTETLEKYK